MKHIKKFENNDELLDFNFPKKIEKLGFTEAFEKYIKGQIVQDVYWVDPYGDYNKPAEERFYGSGIIMENNYKYISHGGGCSGEDCNVTFIISPENTVICRSDW